MTIEWPRPARRLPAVAVALGAAFLAADAASYHDSQSALAYWPLSAAITAERLLPLMASGVLLAQLRQIPRVAATMLLALGAFLGIAQRDLFYLLLAPMPGAAAHAFLTGPLAAVLTGVMLVLPPGRRAWLTLPLAGPTGAVVAIGIQLSDPTLHSVDYRPVAVIAAAWLMLATGLLIRLLQGPWLDVASRVLGSWLIAIGLLFGGAQIASKRTDLTPPDFPAAPQAGAFPGFDGWLETQTGGRP